MIGSIFIMCFSHHSSIHSFIACSTKKTAKAKGNFQMNHAFMFLPFTVIFFTAKRALIDDDKHRFNEACNFSVRFCEALFYFYQLNNEVRVERKGE
jgi:hypothetical protein